MKLVWLSIGLLVFAIVLDRFKANMIRLNWRASAISKTRTISDAFAICAILLFAISLLNGYMKFIKV